MIRAIGAERARDVFEMRVRHESLLRLSDAKKCFATLEWPNSYRQRPGCMVGSVLIMSATSEARVDTRTWACEKCWNAFEICFREKATRLVGRAGKYRFYLVA